VLDKALSGFLILAILGAIGALVYIVANPPPGERFTEFYILGLEGKAEGYPKKLSVGEEGQVIMGIVNQEHERMGYEVDVSIDGDTRRLVEPVYLDNEEKWEQIISFIPEKPGEHQKVEFTLFKIRKLGDDSGNHTSLTLWLGREALDATVLNLSDSEASYRMEVEIEGNETQGTWTREIGPRALEPDEKWDMELDYRNPANQTQKAEITLYRGDQDVYREKTVGDYPTLHLWVDVE